MAKSPEARGRRVTWSDSRRAPAVVESAEAKSHRATAVEDDGELLIGERSGRVKLLTAYAVIERPPSVAHDEVVELVKSRRLGGRGIGWIGAHLLASALVAGSKLWTADATLTAGAEDVGIDHRPTRKG